jgi:monomeric sarcosine oxidase
MPATSRPRIVVFGAGAFGGWSALELVRRGAEVQLIDAWGPGHIRSSSGGETRVIRATYGTHIVYTRMAARALQLWRAYDQRSQRSLLHRTGALWMFSTDDPFRLASAEALRAHDLPVELLSLTEARRRFPQVRFDGVDAVMLEPEAGYLMARQACTAVAEQVSSEGGTVLRGVAPAPLVLDRSPSHVVLQDGRAIEADSFVLACGPWLPSILPDVLEPHLCATRQEVYYFGTPAGDARFDETALPVWLEFGGRFMYGIPGKETRGFKVADDTPGPTMDPTTDERVPTRDGIARVRRFVAQRFPALAAAPLIGTEVCQYESTPDTNFIIDRHPAAANVWIVGGGSGHGFKMGPVVGEMVASLVLGESDPEPLFSLARFVAPPASGWKEKWA